MKHTLFPKAEKKAPKDNKAAMDETLVHQEMEQKAK